MKNPSNIPCKNVYLSNDKEKKKKEKIEQSNYCLFNSNNPYNYIQDIDNTQIDNEKNNSKNIAEPNNNNQNYSDSFVEGDMNNSQNNKDNKNKDSQLFN